LIDRYDHGGMKLTFDEVRAIREARGKVSARHLAKLFGVSHQMISLIHTGASYVWLGESEQPGMFSAAALSQDTPSLPLTPEASTPAGEDHTPPSSPAGTNSEAQP
jgi:hypothetical protein